MTLDDFERQKTNALEKIVLWNPPEEFQ